MKTIVSQRNVNVTTAAAVTLLGPAPHRIGFIVSAPATNRITLSFEPAAVLDQGITVYPADPPFEMKEKDYGDAIGQPVSAISATADQIVTVIEFLSAP